MSIQMTQIVYTNDCIRCILLPFFSSFICLMFRMVTLIFITHYQFIVFIVGDIENNQLKVMLRRAVELENSDFTQFSASLKFALNLYSWNGIFSKCSLFAFKIKELKKKMIFAEWTQAVNDLHIMIQIVLIHLRLNLLRAIVFTVV